MATQKNRVTLGFVDIKKKDVEALVEKIRTDRRLLVGVMSLGKVNNGVIYLRAQTILGRNLERKLTLLARQLKAAAKK